MGKSEFSKDVLGINPEKEIDRICKKLRYLMTRQLKRRGAVVGISGGVDSSVTLGIAVKALGPERVLALMMPERQSSEETLPLSKQAAEHFGCEKVHEDITGILEAAGHYRRYNDAVRLLIPGFSDNWKSKIVTSKPDNRGFTVIYLLVQKPDKSIVKKRLSIKPYLEIVAATNFKQRIRKMLEYYHADCLNYAVFGTPNRLEYDQGFFVKLGDGAADLKPIAHLYKSQVYQIAEFLKVPEKIRKRTPTTDTYSLAQGQDEFYFSLPYDKMDLCLYGKNNGIAVENVAAAADLKPEQVQNIYNDIETKRSTTRYLHLPPLLVEEVPEISSVDFKISPTS